MEVSAFGLSLSWHNEVEGMCMCSLFIFIKSKESVQWEPTQCAAFDPDAATCVTTAFFFATGL